jgi:AcrR family transcriptional regulator
LSSFEERNADGIEENPMNDRIDFKGLDRSVRLQKVIDAATGLFHRKGFKSATLDGLARELGVSKTALYHYVSSKEHLLSMVYGQAFEKIFERVHEISAMDAPADEKLSLILRDHIKNITIKNPALFSVFFAEENQLPGEDFQRIRAEKRKYSRIVEDVIEEGIAQGLFRPTDPRLQANAVLGMCNWVYKWYRPGGSAYTPDQVADHFIRLLEAGYLAATPPGNAAVAPEEATVGGPQTSLPEPRREICQKMRLLCGELSKLVDQIE